MKSKTQLEFKLGTNVHILILMENLNKNRRLVYKSSRTATVILFTKYALHTRKQDDHY